MFVSFTSFFFFFFLLYPLYPLLPPSLPLYSFLLSQRGNTRGGENGRGGEKIYATILTLCFLSHFLRLEEMTLHLSKKVFNTRSRSNQKTSKSSVFPQFIAIISQLFLLFINCNKHRTPFFLLSPRFNRFAPISSYFPAAFQYFLFTSSAPISRTIRVVNSKTFSPALPSPPSC